MSSPFIKENPCKFLKKKHAIRKQRALDLYKEVRNYGFLSSLVLVFDFMLVLSAGLVFVDVFVVFVVTVVFVVVVVFVVDVFAVFAGFTLLLFAGGSGQAAPNTPKIKTAERAKVFFIFIIFSCLLQRFNYICNCLRSRVP